MAQLTEDESMRSAQARLLEQQTILDEAEFYYQAHVKSVIDVYDDKNKTVPAELREQAERATQRIQDAKKMVAARHADLCMVWVRLCAERAVSQQAKTPEGDEPNVDAGPGENRKRGPPGDLLPRDAKRRHGVIEEHGSDVTDPMLEFLEEGKMSLPSYDGLDESHKHRKIVSTFDNYFLFDAEQSDEAEQNHYVDLFEEHVVLVIHQAIPGWPDPKQMGYFLGQRFGSPSEYMSSLAQCAYKLRTKSHVIGNATMSIAKGTVTPAKLDRLVVSLYHAYHGDAWLSDTFNIPTHHNLLTQLASPDSAVVRDMIYKLMHLATALAKYSCLITSITVALAISFKPTGVLAKDATIASAITDTLEHHKELVACFGKVKEWVPDVVPDPFERLEYNRSNAIEDHLNRLELSSRLDPLVPRVPDLIAFLNSRGCDEAMEISINSDLVL
ncbi:hypothetical protein PG984_008492 [Apiospora sp. TS-2023a]